VILLISGLFLFCFVHLFTAFAPQRSDRLRAGLGVNGLKGLVSVGVLAGLVLIVVGWRSATPQWLYAPPPNLRGPALLLIAIGLWLFVVSQRPSVLRRRLRHPQLTGVLLWSVAHLMLNGDSRSLTLFATLALWSVLEIVAINRRDGSYRPPPAPPLLTDIANAIAAALLFLGLAFAHPWLAGVAVIPG
jgi:uncharacterized membrane protein